MAIEGEKIGKYADTIRSLPLPVPVVSITYGLRPRLKSGLMHSTPFALSCKQHNSYSSCSSDALRKPKWTVIISRTHLQQEYFLNNLYLYLYMIYTVHFPTWRQAQCTLQNRKGSSDAIWQRQGSQSGKRKYRQEHEGTQREGGKSNRVNWLQ